MNEFFSYIAVNQQIWHKDKQKSILESLDSAVGLFETILIKERKPLFLAEHLQRLEKSAKELNFLFPYKTKQIEDKIFDLILINKVNLTKLNIYLTAESLIIVMRKIDAELLKMGFKVFLKKENQVRSKFNSFKTLLGIRKVFQGPNLELFEDWLFYDSNKEILESTIANVFFIKDKRLITPKSRFILPGIIRGFILNNAEEWGFEVEERKVFLDELLKFDEVFLTNSLRGIIEVTEVKDFAGLGSGEKVMNLRKKYESNHLKCNHGINQSII